MASTFYEDEILRPFGLLPPTQPRPIAPEQQRATVPIQPLAPEEEASVLSRLGSGALGGLSYIGRSLGKAFGGRAIRGLLGGNPRELASIIPFSDLLGITDPEQEVFGSQLLGGNEETSFLSPQGIGGLGLDILLDPATYLTFGTSALTPLGRAAKQAGVLPKTITGRIAGLGAGTEELATLARQTARPAEELAGQVLGGV